MSWAASRLAIPENAALEVGKQTTKTVYQPSAFLWNWRRGSLAFQNTLICQKRIYTAVWMPLPSSWSKLADDKKGYVFIKQKVNIDPISIPYVRKGFGWPVSTSQPSWSPQLLETGSVDAIAQVYCQGLNLQLHLEWTWRWPLAYFTWNYSRIYADLPWKIYPTIFFSKYSTDDD